MYKNSKENGLSTSWYENGKKRGEGSYKDGRKDGLWTEYYKNGNKEIEIVYNHSLSISTKNWYEDGSLRVGVDVNELIEKDGLSYFKDENKPYTGKFYYIFNDGRSEGNMKNGKLHGLYKTYYKNGNKRDEQNYKNGSIYGLQTGWYENGQKRVKLKFDDDGIISTREWNEDGSVKE